MKRTPGPLLPGDNSRKRGGGRGRGTAPSSLPPSFESWGFSQKALDRVENVLLALKLDLQRQKEILEKELSSLKEREQELLSRQRDLLIFKG